jgi:hypothetical protein
MQDGDRERRVAGWLGLFAQRGSLGESPRKGLDSRSFFGF